MPNWCFNELVVSGAQDELTAFAARARAIIDGEEVALSLHALVPEPDTLDDSEAADWRHREWGTVRELTMDDLPDEAIGLFSYSFSTAWAPPVRWLRHVAPEFPELEFSLVYVEPNMGFAGEARFWDGGQTFTHHHSEDPEGYRELVLRAFPGDYTLLRDEDDEEAEDID
jgi:hypothetical protein